MHGLVGAASTPISGTVTMKPKWMVMLHVAGVCFEPTIHHGISARYDGGRTVTRAPVGATGQREFDGYYQYASQSRKADAFGHSEHVTHNNWDGGHGATATRAAE